MEDNNSTVTVEESDTDQGTGQVLLLPALSQTNVQTIHTTHRRYQRLAISALFGLLSVALAGFIYTQVHSAGSLGRQTLVGIKIAQNLPNQELEQQLKQKIEAFTVSIQKPDGSTSHYGLAQTGARVDIPKAIANAKTSQKQAPLLQRLQWWRHDRLALEVNMEPSKLESFVDENATQISVPPINAALIIEAGQTRITPARNGTAYVASDAAGQITASAHALSSLSLKLEKSVYPAKIADQSVKSLQKKVDTIVTQQVVLSLKNRDFTASPEDIGGWIDLPDFQNAKRADIELNSGKILAYIDKIAEPYVQKTRSEVVMTDPDGQSVLLVRGQDGIDIVDKKSLAVKIGQRLLQGSGFQQELATSSASYETVNAANYPKWLVADISNKVMYAYEGSTLVRSFKISAGAPATPTVIGQFKIQTKLRSQDMRGLNADGTSYFQANVEWINYFSGSYAIHGNYWRPSTWFGNINSSHGCIGITNTDGKWIYEWAPVDTPVITHL